MKQYNAKNIWTDGQTYVENRVAEVVTEVESRKAKSANKISDALPVIDPRAWQGTSVPERKWFVEGWIPDRTVTNLSGDGGSGKTEIILQLIAAASLQTQWFGKDVSRGPCLYYGAEDEADELHRRLETIVDESWQSVV